MDGSVHRRHGEQGKAGTGLRGRRLSVTRSARAASERRKLHDVNVERTNTGTGMLQERAAGMHRE